MLWPGARRAGVDSEVLAELRAIRGEIQGLRDMVANSAKREDLDDYVRRETFDAFITYQKRIADGWRLWLPVVIGALSLIVAIWAGAKK